MKGKMFFGASFYVLGAGLQLENYLEGYHS